MILSFRTLKILLLVMVSLTLSSTSAVPPARGPAIPAERKVLIKSYYEMLVRDIVRNEMVGVLHGEEVEVWVQTHFDEQRFAADVESARAKMGDLRKLSVAQQIEAQKKLLQQLTAVKGKGAPTDGGATVEGGVNAQAVKSFPKFGKLNIDLDYGVAAELAELERKRRRATSEGDRPIVVVAPEAAVSSADGRNSYEGAAGDVYDAEVYLDAVDVTIAMPAALVETKAELIRERLSAQAELAALDAIGHFTIRIVSQVAALDPRASALSTSIAAIEAPVAAVEAPVAKVEAPVTALEAPSAVSVLPLVSVTGTKPTPTPAPSAVEPLTVPSTTGDRSPLPSALPSAEAAPFGLATSIWVAALVLGIFLFLAAAMIWHGLMRATRKVEGQSPVASGLAPTLREAIADDGPRVEDQVTTDPDHPRYSDDTILSYARHASPHEISHLVAILPPAKLAKVLRALPLETACRALQLADVAMDSPASRLALAIELRASAGFNDAWIDVMRLRYGSALLGELVCARVLPQELRFVSSEIWEAVLPGLPDEVVAHLLLSSDDRLRRSVEIVLPPKRARRVRSTAVAALSAETREIALDAAGAAVTLHVSRHEASRRALVAAMQGEPVPRTLPSAG